jgi:cytidylate kinase
VRRVLVEQQRRIADVHCRLVSEGRDQGSVVFPDASLRFFLEANVDVRVERRAAELVGKGQRVDQRRVLDDLTQRDLLDASRSEGPLIRPERAVTIDTSSRSAEEVIDLMERIARARLAQELGEGTEGRRD